MYYSNSICVLAAIVVSFTCVLCDVPSFITPCHKEEPTFSECILQQAKNTLPHFVQGIPEYGMESIDPLNISDLKVSTGTFTIKQNNVILKGLKDVELRELKWDLENNTGFIRMFGNLTLVSDYETDGRILIIPITGRGKLSVKMENSEIIMKYKIKKIQGADGGDHVATYDLKAKQTFENVVFHMTSDLGENILSNTINQVMNDNWRDIMKEVGPPHIKAISAKVSQIINIFYSKIPYEELLP